MLDASPSSSTPSAENSADSSVDSVAKSAASEIPTPESPTSQTTPLLARLPPLFDLGQIVATPGALKALRDAMIEPEDLFNRHQRGDWGDLCAEDRAVNRRALFFGDRLLSAFLLPPARYHRNDLDSHRMGSQQHHHAPTERILKSVFVLRPVKNGTVPGSGPRPIPRNLRWQNLAPARNPAPVPSSLLRHRRPPVPFG